MAAEDTSTSIEQMTHAHWKLGGGASEGSELQVGDVLSGSGDRRVRLG